MNDLSGTVNLLQSAQYAGSKNPVINSNYSVWQRGTSIAIPAATGASSSTFTADRWQTYTNANQAITVSRQATADSTNLPFIQYCARFQRNSGQTGTTITYLVQNFESINSIPLAGKSVTFSFYARKGANYSPNFLNANLWTGTGTDQSVLVGMTGQVTAISQNATLTTTWQRFTYTATLAATATQIAIGFGYTPIGTAGAADYFEITGVQVEASTVASAYSPNGATYQAELAACQRYYQTYTLGQFTGQAINGTTAQFFRYLPVVMRTSPTGTFPTAPYPVFIEQAGVAFFTPTTLTVALTNTSTYSFTAGGAVAMTDAKLCIWNGTAIGLSAEL
jgi:hypothetical protein